jgi:hypothetical protein
MNTISALHSHTIFQRQSVTPPVQGQSAQQANPAQAARAALTDRPDLAGKPFGSLVSLFAKDLPLPPMENAGDVDTGAEDLTPDSSESPTAV